MRYGKPSIQSALNELKNCDQITILPLYPQYSSAAMAVLWKKSLSEVSKNNTFPEIKIIPHFFNHPIYIKAQAELIKPYLIETRSFFLAIMAFRNGI